MGRAALTDVPLGVHETSIVAPNLQTQSPGAHKLMLDCTAGKIEKA